MTHIAHAAISISSVLSATSATMRRLGILQDDDADGAKLRKPASPFDLPAEANQAQAAIDALLEKSRLIQKEHTFKNGMGLAAPQIGIDRRAAVIYPPGVDDPIVLLNPRVLEESAEPREPHFEGCLSFFDVRGRVARPQLLHVEHQSLEGQPTTTSFRNALARLVAHEADHLDGCLYTDRLAAAGDPPPIPVEEYHRIVRG